ncbi:hypothetical protein [Halorarum salinum]|uniref:DUF7847 domain-containing protein n=1 Tax=Halorarum salinum TaxID=2743089 RepID=A0A7D5QFU3_9EURY|nr:hypothetical protein [Halobaculum salinum]QLG60964.1 hypothetical protein HUG12_04130 [Halobaculum salinum]
MSPTLDVGGALSYGFDRLTTRGGAILIGAYVLFQVVTQVSFQSLFAELFAGVLPAERLAQTYPLALDLPIGVSGGSTVLLLIAGSVLAVVTMRAIHDDIDRMPTADHTRRLVRTVVVMIVVSIVTFVAILIGTVFLVLPGIFLAVSLVFAQPAVVLEDAGVVEALERSWSLTAGNRIRLFALGVVIAVVAGIAGGAFSLLGIVSPTVGTLLSSIVSAIMSLFGLAVLVGAYRQLAAENGTRVPPSR